MLNKQPMDIQAYRSQVPVSLVKQAETWDTGAPRTLAAGPDTVYFSFDTEVGENMWSLLEAEQQTARDIYDERKAEYAPDWLGGVIATSGARGGYRFRIETPDFTVKLLRGIDNRPPIYVEMRSMGLHLHPGGALGACEAACAYLRDVLGDWGPEEAQALINLDTAKCSRLDIHVDWQGGWTPTLTDAEQHLFIKPGRCKWHPWVDGNQCTGYVFGSGKVSARIYNKTQDVARKHLDWYGVYLTQRNGASYAPDLPVWRLEFQLMRDGVKGFKLYAKPDVSDEDSEIQAELDREDLPHIGSVRKALHWSGHEWAYLTQHWLRLTEPTEDENRARWPTHPTWQMLQAGYAVALNGAPLSTQQLQLIRKQRHTGYERFLHRIEVGVLAMTDALASNAVEVAHSWYAHLAHVLDVAQLVEQQRWQELHMTEEQAKQMLKEYGIRGSPERQGQLFHLIAELLGLFTSAGVAKSELPAVGDCADLLIPLLDDMEKIAKSKGGIGQMLNDKRTKLYKLSPRRYFAQALGGNAS